MEGVSNEPAQRYMKNRIKIPLIVTVSALVWATGCQQTSQQRRPAPAPASKAPAAAHQTCTEPTRGMVGLAKVMPKEAHLGETFEYQLVLNAQDCVGNVVVTDLVPAGASYVKSEPAAAVSEDLLTWRLNPMDAGAAATIRVWLKADKEGTLASCATISADPRVCAATFVGKAMLSVEKTGPETAILGSTNNYQIVVVNRGTTEAHDVVITDTVPEGLQSADGQKTLTFRIGNLPQNQPKTITVPLKAVARGKHCNTAVAKSSNAGQATDDACTTVMQPGLKIVKTGDKERFLGRNASYKVVVSNTGDTVLSDVTVTDTAPAATKIVSASGATVTGNQAVWRIASLPAGQERSLDVVLTSTTAGNHCNVASVTAAGGLQDKAEACTLWRGVAAVLLEVVDDPDPIQVDEQTTYTIRVTNQGTADLTNIGIAAAFDEEMSPVSSPEGTVSGQNARFPAVRTLAPKQSFTYTIRAKGVKAGDARNRVTMTADGLASPVEEEESTHVY